MECSQKAQQCEKDKQPYYKRMGELQTQLTNWFMQMPGACGNPCNCGPCNSLQGQISGTCSGELTSVVNRIQQPCDLPSYCADMGISAPGGSGSSSMVNMCKMQFGSCGEGGFLGALKCMLGS